MFKNRFSPRLFSSESVNQKDLEIIFEAVRFTPSSYNLQPWYFYVGKKGGEFFKKLSKTLMEGNNWAKNVPVLILACYIDESDYGKNYYAQYDLGQTVATLVYQAQDLGYYCHQMADFDHQKAKEIIKEKTKILGESLPWEKLAIMKKLKKKLLRLMQNQNQEKKKFLRFFKFLNFIDLFPKK
ncbi:MAG: nitroreductase family protein [Patescibacteria group bacterium]|nr:nitroreductase family protein [Patescibacteria group bacterium]